MRDQLYVDSLVTEHQITPLGIDIKRPRFGWKLRSKERDVVQTAYRLQMFAGQEPVVDTGRIESDASTEVVIEGWEAAPMTRYDIAVRVWDNLGREASTESWFETGRLGTPFTSGWVEPEQIPTPPSMEGKDMSKAADGANPYREVTRDFAEFRPPQRIRIPFVLDRPVKRARVYATAHGIYEMEVNGRRADERKFAPENTTYKKLLQYQTYDVTAFLRGGENVIGVTVADGWWAGRVGTTGDCCQYGDKVGLLLDGVIEYQDGTTQNISAEQGVSSTGPFVYADLFVGERYDAGRETPGWSSPGFDDSDWKPVKKAVYPMDHLVGQYAPPVHVICTRKPEAVFVTPAGETIIDVGQVVAGVVGFTVTAPAGVTITLEHTEILDESGNYYNNILGVNKEQMDVYITKAGTQTYCPHFTYHGFRYVKVSGWPGRISANDFTIYIYSSQMEDIGSFSCSDERLNRLAQNIWWSQVANTISIPSDCPQREKAGWTGDIMAFAPTLTFNRGADAFLTSWMNNVRADQLENGAIPDIVPDLPAYKQFLTGAFGFETSCGWGDAVIMVPYAVYQQYGDRRILEENYGAMTRWMAYIKDRCENNHPEGYENWDEARKARSRYLWNTDFHFGDWLIPSIVLGNPDGMAMNSTATATMHIVAPAFAAFSAMNMAKIAGILGKDKDQAYYGEQYRLIRKAFIEEYIHEDGTMDADFQGIYVIALKIGLVPDELREKMTAHLCEMIEGNRGCLDTGFLSVPFLMDVLTENGRRDVAYRLLFQTQCPSWLYMVEHGATTMWESWGAIGEDGAVSTYSYNHYAFGCVGEWIYREIGGLKALAPGYRKILVEPALDCGLTRAAVSEETPYGRASVDWEIIEGRAIVHVCVPVNTTAEIRLPGQAARTVGSGAYVFTADVREMTAVRAADKEVLRDIDAWC